MKYFRFIRHALILGGIICAVVLNHAAVGEDQEATFDGPSRTLRASIPFLKNAGNAAEGEFTVDGHRFRITGEYLGIEWDEPFEADARVVEPHSVLNIVFDEAGKGRPGQMYLRQGAGNGQREFVEYGWQLKMALPFDRDAPAGGGLARQGNNLRFQFLNIENLFPGYAVGEIARTRVRLPGGDLYDVQYSKEGFIPNYFAAQEQSYPMADDVMDLSFQIAQGVGYKVRVAKIWELEPEEHGDYDSSDE
jgi:hypothetical protein